MATTPKKPAAKTAAKAPAKPAAKKPAAKTAAKPAAKTTAKPAAKAAAKPAAKTTAKAAAKPAAKTTAKAAAKPAAKAAAKTTAKAAAKPAPAKQKKTGEADVPYRNLFEAYTQGKLPFAQGYIISSFFDEKSSYSIYEVVSYAGVKEIYMAGNGLTFVTGGKKLFILIEPDTYRLKYQEPVSRAEGERIPKRFNELDIEIAKNQTKIMIAKMPDETFGSFTILKPTGMNFSIVFYEHPDMYKTLGDFFAKSLNQQRKVPAADAKKAGEQIAKTVQKFMGFESQFN